MISKNLLLALEDLGFTLSADKTPNKTHAYAAYGGYFITVYEANGKKIAYFNFKVTDNEENSLKLYNMSESFSSEMDEFNISDYSIFEDGMRVYFAGNASAFIKLLDKCITFLSENEIRGVGYCSNCGNKFGSRNPKKVTQGNENKLMCEHCALETLESNKKTDIKPTTATKKQIASGTISSVLFSILGVGIYFLVYYFLSPAISKSEVNDARWIFCVLGAVVSLLAYAGYRVGCKAPGKIAYFIIGFNSLLFTAIGQYLGVVFEFIAKGGFKLGALSNKAFWLIHLRNTVPAEITDNFISYSSLFYKLLAISLMFAIVSAAILLLTLHDKTNPKNETAEIETIKL